MRPSRWFVRVWTPDPAEEGPDDEQDFDVVSGSRAKATAKHLRKGGKLAGAFERLNIHVPDDIAVHLDDPPPHLWEYESVQIDEDEIEREDRRRMAKATAPKGERT